MKASSIQQVPSLDQPVLRTGQVRIKGSGSLSGWVWKVKSVALTDKALVTPDYKILLDHITKVERVDVKPYCLLLEASNRRYHLSFENDGELYDWQEDVYSRCPLVGGGNPFGFVHQEHVGFDPVSGYFTGLPSQWGENLGVAPESNTRQSTNNPPLATDPSASHSTPADQQALATMVLDGHFSFKGDGFFAWRWQTRWLALGPRTLTINKSKESMAGTLINLRDITAVDRAELRPHCLVVGIKNGKRYFLSFRNDEQLYDWQEAIYSRSPLAGISSPTDFVHHVHVGFDALNATFTGLPDQWEGLVLMQNTVPPVR